MRLFNIWLGFVSLVVLSAIFNIHNNYDDRRRLINSSKKNQPNIIYILLDDVGFSEMDFNGGNDLIGVTPTITSFANNGIQFNNHYSESSCAPTRASFLTGRYAFRTGIDQVYQMMSQASLLDDNPPLISELLKDEGYKTLMVGKWHVGYQFESDLPQNKGFDDTIFYSDGQINFYNKLTAFSYPLMRQTVPPNEPVNQSLWDELIQITNGLWRAYLLNTIDENRDYIPLIDTSTYVEDIFYNKIESFINKNSDNDPFFIFYGAATPHSPVVEPPKTTPKCDSILVQGRKDFCNQMFYVDLVIKNITNILKDKNLYDNTIIVVASDNGGQNNVDGFIPLQQAFGQNLPLRGSKVSSFEGGIRAWAVMGGGYINKIGINGCEYNGLMHVSDWYPLFSSFGGLSKNELSKLDIDGINIWTDIERKCIKKKIQRRSSRTIKKRNEIVSLKYCSPDYEPSTFSGIINGWIRKGDWKLIINDITGFCNGDELFVTLAEIQGEYLNFDGSFSRTPNVESYLDFQSKPKKIAKLYKSKCYDKFLRNETSNYSIERPEIMLFNIRDDNIEACNVAHLYPGIVSQLLGILETNFPDSSRNNYIGSSTLILDKNALYEQYLTYDCSLFDGISFTRSLDPSNINITWNDALQLAINKIKSCQTQ